VRWLNPSAVLNFRKQSMALAKESETSDFDVPGELRFIRNSSIFGKMSTAVRQANEKLKSLKPIDMDGFSDYNLPILIY
jgi:hypothetical protein